MRILFALLLLPLVASAATTLAPGTYTVAKCPATPPPCTAPSTLVNGVCTPPVTTPPAAGSAQVYNNGVFSWAGDYSFQVVLPLNYQDTTGGADGTYDLKITTLAGGGGWQPFAQGKQFDTRPYTKLTYCVKPTSAGMVIGTGFAAINDVADGNQINIGGGAGAAYGPTPTAGVWGCYTIPLTAFGLTNPIIQKFTVATGIATTYFVDAVSFLP